VNEHIGIAAVSPEGAALCYRQITRHAAKMLAPNEAPRITLHNEPLGKYIDAVLARDWRTIGELLSRSATMLAGCGATFCLSPDNAIQHGVHVAEGDSPIPWLTMTDIVADAIAADGRKVVGLLGTRLVTTGSAYQTALGLKGIKVISPDEKEREEVDRIILGELVYGRVNPESSKIIHDIIDHLAQRGCEGIILAYSEAPLSVTVADCQLPAYDPSDLLALGAIKRVMKA
jgi:aspartate racemase